MTTNAHQRLAPLLLALFISGLLTPLTLSDSTPERHDESIIASGFAQPVEKPTLETSARTPTDFAPARSSSTTSGRAGGGSAISLWALSPTSATNTSDNRANNLVTDSAGNAYLMGSFSGTTTFGSITLTSNGQRDIYVAMLDNRSNWAWAVMAGGIQEEVSWGIALDAGGDLFITGSFQATATFGSTTLVSSGGEDIFIAKLSSNGGWLWAKAAGGTGNDQGRDVQIDSVGNVIVGGMFTGTAFFGTLARTSSGAEDVFVANLSGSGGWNWVVTAGGSDEDQLFALALGPAGGIQITGWYFDDITFGSHTLQIGGVADMFVGKLSQSGSWTSAVRVGGTGGAGYIFGYSIEIDGSGNTYVTAIYYDTVHFDSITKSGGGLSGSGYILWDLVVAKLSSSNIWDWVADASGPESEYGFDLALDGSGSVYLVGFFRGSSMFGSTTLSGTNREAFVAKLSSGGNWLWAISAGGSGSDAAGQLAPLPNGNFLVVGHFENSATFGTHSISSTGAADTFAAEVDTGGSWISVRGPADGAHGIGRDVVLDANGSSYVVGNFSGRARFGSHLLTSTGGSDLFIARISPLGAWEWVVGAGGNGDDLARGIGLDGNGDLLVTGDFEGSADFGSTTLTSNGGRDIFLARLSSSGSWLWAIGAGGSGDEVAGGIAMGSAAESYVAGRFNGSLTVASSSLTSQGGEDVLVLRASGAGAWEWGTSGGGAGDDVAMAIASDAFGSPFIAGGFSGTAQFGTHQLTSLGQQDGLIAKLGSDGSWQWVLRGGGAAGDLLRGIAIDSGGNAVVTGDFHGSAVFGQALTSQGLSDVLIASISSNGSWNWARAAGGAENDIGRTIAVGGNGLIDIAGELQGTASFGPTTLVTNGSSDLFVSQLDENGSWSQSFTTPSQSRSSANGIDADSNGRILLTGSFRKGLKLGSINLQSTGQDSPFVWLFESDADDDGVADVSDNCPDQQNAGQEDLDDDGRGDVCDDDDDGDGIPDASDLCPRGRTGWIPDTSNDHDGDGCHDDEDSDDDNDGISDNQDNCQRGATDWDSSEWEVDHDQDGCRDSDEDPDDDNDGALDEDDNCRNGDVGWSRNITSDYDDDGCRDANEDLDDDGDGIPDIDDDCWLSAIGFDSNNLTDHDSDGCRDETEDDDDDNDGTPDAEDLCPRGVVDWPSRQRLINYDDDGCRDEDEDADDDNDGVADSADICPRSEVGWISTILSDADGDGCRDADEDLDDDDDDVIDSLDLCPSTSAGEQVDERGCSAAQRDLDLDGVKDLFDECPNTPREEQADIEGCSSSQLDEDADGVDRGTDLCPSTPEGENVDADGCAWSQLDEDGDGVSNGADECPDTTLGSLVGPQGCSAAQRDGDGDNVTDERDQCINTPEGEAVDYNGCSNSQRDSDGDGVSDDIDTCPGTLFGIEINAVGCSAAQDSAAGQELTVTNLVIIIVIGLLALAGSIVLVLLVVINRGGENDDDLEEEFESGEKSPGPMEEAGPTPAQQLPTPVGESDRHALAASLKESDRGELETAPDDSLERAFSSLQHTTAETSEADDVPAVERN